MENSPPGIRAIPFGGAPSDGRVLAFVGWNSSAGAWPLSLAVMATSENAFEVMLLGRPELTAHKLVGTVGWLQRQAITIEARIALSPTDPNQSVLLFIADAFDIAHFQGTNPDSVTQGDLIQRSRDPSR